MSDLQIKNEINDNIFLTSVNEKFKDHKQRFKRKKLKKVASKNKYGKLFMYENKNNNTLPKMKNQDSVDK